MKNIVRSWITLLVVASLMLAVSLSYLAPQSAEGTAIMAVGHASTTTAAASNVVVADIVWADGHS